MRTYSNPLFEKNGLALVEVWKTDAAGQAVHIGYAILSPDGAELDFFVSYEEALAEFERITDDNKPSSGYEP